MISKIGQMAIPFIWLGFVCAISFMEAPLKFQAPNITIPLGLGIGHIVFHALNKIEIVLGILLLISFFLNRPKSKIILILFGIIASILLIQTIILFPMLDERTFKVINGTAEPFSNLHIVYIVTDATKVLLLLSLGVLTNKYYLNYERY
ncbi:MAG: hypothetical protein MUC29_12285 [Pyrinomonadaceae bacterium]|nr:hypothetical protein [Pyrinomonadaceae bacterium]